MCTDTTSFQATSYSPSANACAQIPDIEALEPSVEHGRVVAQGGEIQYEIRGSQKRAEIFHQALGLNNQFYAQVAGLLLQPLDADVTHIGACDDNELFVASFLDDFLMAPHAP